MKCLRSFRHCRVVVLHGPITPRPETAMHQFEDTIRNKILIELALSFFC